LQKATISFIMLVHLLNAAA